MDINGKPLTDFNQYEISSKDGKWCTGYLDVCPIHSNPFSILWISITKLKFHRYGGYAIVFPLWLVVGDAWEVSGQFFSGEEAVTQSLGMFYLNI